MACDLTATLGATKIPIKASYKYLGVILGNVSPEQAYAPALQKALRRPFLMQHWKLSLHERVEPLKLWIIPSVIYPAIVIFPSKPVISTLRTICNIALKLTSRGITHKILSLPK